MAYILKKGKFGRNQNHKQKNKDNTKQKKIEKRTNDDLKKALHRKRKIKQQKVQKTPR